VPTNIPTKKSGVRIKCKRGISGDYNFITADGWRIETCYSPTELARLVEYARDRGYEHAMADIRDLIRAKGE
jgi:hypothetical protein